MKTFLIASIFAVLGGCAATPADRAQGYNETGYAPRGLEHDDWHHYDDTPWSPRYYWDRR